MKLQRTKMCSRCQAEFLCGPPPAAGRCWCEDLPPVLPLSEADCLCPQCLREKITALVGLCASCRHAQTLKTKGGSAVFLCGLAAGDKRFSKYPRLPMASCPGHAPS